MAAERIRLEVRERESVGTRASRRLRREGFIPGVLYGGASSPRSFAVSERELRRALGGQHGVHAILDVVLEGQQKAHHAVLKDYQLDPRRSTLLHVDLHEVRLDRPIHAQVALELVGTPEGVTFGGVISQTLREVTVEALPTDVPDRFELDITPLAIGDSVNVSEIVAPEGVTILENGETVVASILAPRRIELPEEVPAEEEGVEEEEAAEAAPEAEAPAETESEASEP